jgi:hypothetical protein
LDEPARRLGVELAAQWEVDVELEALRTSAVLVRDLVLDNIDGPSFLAASLSTVVELLKGQIDTAPTNGVCWGTRSALVAILLHFLELKFRLELFSSRRNANLTEDWANAL